MLRWARLGPLVIEPAMVRPFSMARPFSSRNRGLGLSKKREVDLAWSLEKLFLTTRASTKASQSDTTRFHADFRVDDFGRVEVLHFVAKTWSASNVLSPDSQVNFVGK